MTTTKEAKNRLVINIFTNIMNVGITSLILIWLTPYLIKSLGIGVYGVYPLINTIVIYFMNISSTYTSAISRFVAIYIDKSDVKMSCTYLSTAFYSLLLTNLFILFIVIISSYFLPSIINIPSGYEQDACLLFILMMFSALCNTLASPFWVSTFVTHRFDLQNFSIIFSRFLQVTLIVGCFIYFGASLKFVGFGRIGMFLFQLICAIYLTKLLLPGLQIRINAFNWKALVKMGRMSGWMSIDTIGTLLYLNTDLIVINLILGAEKTGFYAIILQWIILLQTLSPAFSNVFAPIAIDYIAKNRLSDLACHVKRTIKFMGVIMAFPVGLICGLSLPILYLWVGPSFIHLSPLMKMMIFPQVIYLSIGPLYNINRGMNRVKTPALVTLAGGVLNLILSIIFLKYTSFGLYGIAFATIISFTIRSVLFSPLYAASIMGQRLTIFLTPIIPGIIGVILISLAGNLTSRFVDLNSYFSLAATVILIGIVYAPVCYFIFLNENERKFIISIIGKKITI